jgi:hypothetical protein
VRPSFVTIKNNIRVRRYFLEGKMLKHALIAFAFAMTIAGATQVLAQSCPANSHLVSSGNGVTRCQCNEGYVASGGQCVKA